MTEYTKQNIKNILYISLFSAVVGITFSILIYHFAVNVQIALYRFILLGGCTGFFIALLAGTLTSILRSYVQNPPVVLKVFMEPVLYTCIIVLVFGFFFYLFMSHELPDDKTFWNSAYLPQTVLFSFTMFFFINTAQTIQQLIGQKAVGRLLFGKYHRPVREERFVMYIDIVNSTSIAEEIGDNAFHSFIRDFFRDISNPILKNRAEIYKYVGDEVILTWKYRDGVTHNNAVTIVRDIRNHLQSLAPRYKKQYGRMPVFRTGLHFGPVLVGELGHLKLEIALLGDVMNTAARIQAACSELNAQFLLSDAALSQFHPSNIPNHYFRSIGSISLKGKERPLPLYAVEEHP